MAVETSSQAIRLVTPDGAVIEGSDALQGTWTVDQYLRLGDHVSHPIEFTDGEFELLPMPTDKDQVIIAFLYRMLFAYLERTGGVVLFAALRLLIREGKFREPDLMLLRDADDPRRENRYWRGADLVIEVVSEDDPERDTVVKRSDYAEGGIPEYWIVNPLDETITVLALPTQGVPYTEHGVFGRGETATSVLLPGFSMRVSEVFDAR